MKNGIYILAVILSVLMVSCEPKSNDYSEKALVKVKKAGVAAFVPPPLEAIDNDILLDRDDVNNKIAPYMNTPNAISDTTSYFTISTTTLVDYLNDAKNLNAINYIHVALYLDIQNDDTSLRMALAGVDDQGNYAYIEKEGVDKFFVLDCDPATPGDGIDTLEIPTGTAPASGRIRKNFPERMNITSATMLIDSFRAKNRRGLKNTTAFSFLINADDLYNYASAYSKCDQIQFFLGDDHGRLTLITAALAGREHIYFFDNHLKNCVLERAMPCPECELPDDGKTLGTVSFPSKKK